MRAFLSHVAAAAIAIFGVGPLIAALFAVGVTGLALAQQGNGPIPNSTNQGNFGPTIQSIGSHVSYGGGLPPSLSTGCGTAPTAPIGTDTNFKFKSGTSTANTCAVTFAQSWNQSPVCQITSETGSVPAYGPVTITSLPVTGVADSVVYHVQCYGRPGG